MLRYKNCHLAPVSTSLLCPVKYSTLDFWPYVVCLWFEDHLSASQSSWLMIWPFPFEATGQRYKSHLIDKWKQRKYFNYCQIENKTNTFGHWSLRMSGFLLVFPSSWALLARHFKFETSSFIDWYERMFFSCGRYKNSIWCCVEASCIQTLWYVRYKKIDKSITFQQEELLRRKKPIYNSWIIGEFT